MIDVEESDKVDKCLNNVGESLTIAKDNAYNFAIVLYTLRVGSMMWLDYFDMKFDSFSSLH